MGFQKGQKPQVTLPADDPAVIEEKRMLADRVRAENVSVAERERIDRIAAEDAQKVAATQASIQAAADAVAKAAQDEQNRRLQEPLSEDEQIELADLERQANSGAEVAREQMLRLSELRIRSKVKKAK